MRATRPRFLGAPPTARSLESGPDDDVGVPSDEEIAEEEGEAAERSDG